MISIDVHIAGKTYPLKIKTSDRAHMKDVMLYVNKKVSDFQGLYPKKEGQDHLAMALLTICDELKTLESSVKGEELTSKLDAVESAIDDLIF